MSQVMKMPGRNKTPIQKVKVSKVPSHLKTAFKGAIVAKVVDIIYENGVDVIVCVYDKIEGPLGDFLKNAPNMVVQVGCDAVKLAEEAFAEAIKASDTVVRAVVEGTEAVVYVVGKGAETVGHEVENFVVHTVGDPVVHEFDKLGNTITREADNFSHTVTREADNFAHTVDSVVKDVGGFFL
ncbi:Polyribonucleotide nucleotidyltransferase [Bienertia sinuspersici]